MSDVYEIYDPVNLKLYSIDINEIRFWLDVPKLQEDYSKIPELRQSFGAMETDKREYFLKLMDKHETIIPFQIRHWTGIPGVNIGFDLNIVHTHDTASHYDAVNSRIRDSIFFEKSIRTLPQNANIHIENKYFPVRAIYGISEDFWDVQDLTHEHALPVFDQNVNTTPESTTRILLDSTGRLNPVEIIVTLMTVENWTYQLRITFMPSVDPSLVLWPNIPNAKPLYEFFNNQGYKIRGETGKRVIWENEKEGNIIEYNTPPPHLFNPFLVIKQHNGEEDLLARNKLGKELIERMRKTGLWDEILYFRAYLLETKALGKIQNKNKTAADILLSEAIMQYDECEENMWGPAQSEAMFCAWLKSRIAVGKGDKEVEYRSYMSIARRLAEGHLWKEFAWFLNKVHQEDRKMPMKIIKDFLPMAPLDKYYFVDQKSYKEILEFWDFAYAKEKRPENVQPSVWHYRLSKQAYDIGLKETAKAHLLRFFRETEREKRTVSWMVDGVEELMEYSIKLGLKDRYFKFAQTMVKNIEVMKKREGMGDMSAIGRKAYRWSLLVMTLSESRWALHSAVLLQKENREKRDQIKLWFKKSYETFRESILHYDPTEDYTKEQSCLIGKGFVSAYHLGFNYRDEQLMGYVQQLATELWEKNPSKELYLALHSIFSTERRQEMADLLIGNWISDVKEKEGKFVLDVKRTIELSSLYLGVEEWEEASKTMNYGLSNFEWNFEDLNEIFESFLVLQKYAPQHAVLCEKDLSRWIEIFKEEQRQIKKSTVPMIARMKKIEKV